MEFLLRNGRTYTVDFRHRIYPPSNGRKGQTACVITEMESRAPHEASGGWVGIAHCGKHDQFSRKVGREVAFLKAIDRINDPFVREEFEEFFRQLRLDRERRERAKRQPNGVLTITVIGIERDPAFFDTVERRFAEQFEVEVRRAFGLDLPRGLLS